MKTCPKGAITNCDMEYISGTDNKCSSCKKGYQALGATAQTCVVLPTGCRSIEVAAKCTACDTSGSKGNGKFFSTDTNGQNTGKTAWYQVCSKTSAIFSGLAFLAVLLAKL